jgi:hypothetical protein
VDSFTSKRNAEVLASHDSIQIKILSYFGVRDRVYDTLTQINRDSLFFLRKNHEKMERDINELANDTTRLTSIKSVEEH